MHEDCPLTKNGLHYVKWALKLGECIYTKREQASLIIGLIAILCYAVAQLPQMYKNQKLKRLPGLSPLFIMMCLLGDSCNLVGSLLSHQLATQLYSAIYFVLIDLIMITQIVWIKCRTRNIPPVLLNIENRPLLDTLEQGNSQRLYSFAPMILVLIANASTSIIQLETTEAKIGYVIGCVSSTSYIVSRIPQIYKNWKRKSVDGLSPWIFISTTSGNVLYLTSIVLMSVDWRFIIGHLPWLIGSIVPLGLDMFILSQFCYYRN